MTATSTASRTPTGARLTACGVLAVILNAGALGVVVQLSPHAAGVTPEDHPAESPTRVVLLPAPGIPTANDSPGGVAAPAPSAQRGPQASRPATARATTVATTTAPSQPVLFYAFHEVDNPAYPMSDWNLDVDTLDEIGITRLVFEVLINDRGEVVGCTVLDPTGLPDDVRHRLEQRLSETTLEPAQRAGQRVASMRRIELVVAPAPPAVLPDPAARRP
jgi:hypothetical protein